MNKNMIEDFESVIGTHKFSMMALYIYYCLKCNDEFKTLNSDEVCMLVNMVYEAYMKDENHTDIGYICDKAMDNKEEIFNNKYRNVGCLNYFTAWDLLEKCY